MGLHLLAHNIFFLIGGLINIGVCIFVFASTWKRPSVVATTFALSSLAVSIFQISHLLGTNAPTAELSRAILMFNLTDIFIGIFMTHWFLAFIGKARRQWLPITIVYITGIALFVFFLIFPASFLNISIQKLYLPYYYDAGPGYIVMLGWFLCVSVYHFSQLAIAYKRESDPIQKKRFGFVLMSMVYAYIFGTTAFILVFSIPFDPMFSSFFGLYPVFLVYTILQYEIFDIRVLAKRTFAYGSAILIIGIAITSFNLLGIYFNTIEPDFPKWLMPAILSFLVGSSVVYVWRKAHEADVSKYEFITVVTHKFRTPLTRIKWAAEDIIKIVPENKKEMVDTILESERELISLTDILVGLSNVKGDYFEYRMAPLKVEMFIQEILLLYEGRSVQKGIVISHSYAPDLVILADAEKLRLALQIILDNAFTYTPAGGSISIRTMRSSNGRHGIFEIHDTGIGMSKETIAHAFTRFYRGSNARSADTEGMGIGLFMAKNIIERMNGKIWLSSEGEGRGSILSILLPIKSGVTIHS